MRNGVDWDGGHARNCVIIHINKHVYTQERLSACPALFLRTASHQMDHRAIATTRVLAADGLERGHLPLARARALTHIHTRARTHSHPYVPKDSLTSIRAQALTHIHTRPRTHSHPYAPKDSLTSMRVQELTHIHTCPRTHSIHACARAHSHPYVP